MSAYIPPILSSSPPPMDAVDDDDDDFGDFAGAHYTNKEDNLVSKLNLDEPSWNGPDLNTPPTQPSTPIKLNGAIPNHTKSERSRPTDWGTNEDEETQQQTDNTSQNSVVSGGSGITDSGLCSASQNSEGVSPLPQVDLCEEEAQPQTVASPIDCNSLENVNGNSALNNSTVKDILNRSEEGSISEESSGGFVSRRSSSPPDLDLDINILCGPETTVDISNENNGFAPDADEWGGTGDRDFSSFDPLPLSSKDNSPRSDLSPEEEVKEDLNDLKPLEFEPIQPQVEEISIIEGEEGVQVLPVENKDLNEIDEFSNFEEPYIPPKTEVHEEVDLNSPVHGAVIEESLCNQEDDEDDFADFESAQPDSEPVQEKEVGSLFADFSNINNDNPEEASSPASQWAVPASERPPSGLSDTDSFGDFESDTLQPSFSSCDDVRKRLPEVLSTMFPPVEELEQCVLNDESNRTDEMRLDAEDSVPWLALRDLESTPAMSFHWPGSHANRCLLAALNIDSRNVLFGPKWSTVVPRFASNLSFSPLEPVRAGQMQTQENALSKQPEPAVSPLPASQASAGPLEDVVPAAQFDWSGSGLENPLECKWQGENGSPRSSLPPSPSLSPPSPSLAQTPSPLPFPLQPAVAPLTAPAPTPALAPAPAPAPAQPKVSRKRDSALSPEAVRVLDTLPELAFLSAKKLMFPVYGDLAVHKH